MSFFAGLKLRRDYSAWALLVIMAVVALVAYQQYRWIEKVAQVEAKTSREKFEASLNAIAGDFDTEITRAQLLFMGLDGQTRSDILRQAQERLQVFRKLSSDSPLIASVDVDDDLPAPYIIDPGPPPALTVPATSVARKIKRGMPIFAASGFMGGIGAARVQTGTVA
jgi:hypothetical protein